MAIVKLTGYSHKHNHILYEVVRQKWCNIAEHLNTFMFLQVFSYSRFERKLYFLYVL